MRPCLGGLSGSERQSAIEQHDRHQQNRQSENHFQLDVPGQLHGLRTRGLILTVPSSVSKTYWNIIE